MPKAADNLTKQLDKSLREILSVSGSNKKSMMLNSFLRGLAQGFGAVVGGTILVALLIWVLGLFDEIPLLGPSLDAISDSISK